jgi:hypothetical protein
MKRIEFPDPDVMFKGRSEILAVQNMKNVIGG